MKMLVTIIRELFGWAVLVLLWLREIAGWVLLVGGMLIFYVCFVSLLSTPPRIIIVVPLTFIGFIMFRGGIHMLKVSTAGLICLRAQKQLDDTDGRLGARKSSAPAGPRTRTVPFYLGQRNPPP